MEPGQLSVNPTLKKHFYTYNNNNNNSNKSDKTNKYNSDNWPNDKGVYITKEHSKKLTITSPIFKKLAIFRLKVNIQNR